MKKSPAGAGNGRNPGLDAMAMAINLVDPPMDGSMWGPPVVSWFINPINYSYKYHKP